MCIYIDSIVNGKWWMSSLKKTQASFTAPPLYLRVPSSRIWKPSHLQEDLVSIVVLGLPADLADWAAGVWQQGHQHANIPYPHLHHRWLQHHRRLTSREPLKRQLDLHIWVGVNYEEAKVLLLLRYPPLKQQHVQPHHVHVILMSAVNSKSHDFFPVMHLSHGPQRCSRRQGEEVLAARRQWKHPLAIADFFSVMVSPWWPLQSPVQHQDLLLAAVSLLEEDDDCYGGLAGCCLVAILMVLGPGPLGDGGPLRDPEELQLGVDPRQHGIGSSLQELALAGVGDEMDTDEEGILELAHG